MVFDVGANRGQTANKFTRWWPNAEIHAFEPFPAALSELRRAAVRFPKVRAVGKAVGAKPGQLDVSERPGSESNSLVPDLSATGFPPSAG